VRLLFAFLASLALVATVAGAETAAAFSTVIEAAGKVEVFTTASGAWRPARVGQQLSPGARVRTAAASRAAIQLSDRSVVRLNERSTLEILPPRDTAKRRFSLPRGSIFFFNREKPADIEFDTPLAAGAIRGTEFLLETTDDPASLRLALIDGAVTLRGGNTDVALERNEELRWTQGAAPQKTALLNAAGAIQWALYYPAVLAPKELNLLPGDQAALREALAHYEAGDLLAALAAAPAADSLTGGAKVFRAALELAAGRVAAAEEILSGAAREPGAAAVRELIATVRGEATPASEPRTASEWLARSYTVQLRADLDGALAAAKRAAQLAPSGFAHARVAELEFAFERRGESLAALGRALAASPRLAHAHALRGFVQLEQGDTAGALASFDRARELDAALGSAWLGRGLVLMRRREFAGARAAFQAAAALEPRRALFRSYLAKAAGELRDSRGAAKDFALARQLDASDPTAWLYSALHLWQENRLNEAIRDLERSLDLNDRRAVFRSQLLLDRDRAVRSANLAALYEDAGLADVSRHAAARAVGESYADFSGHLFLANSYQALESANRFDLRMETARQSELLLANLLAPPGAGNLSQLLPQQEHLRYFDPRPVGVSVLVEYGSAGEWRRAKSLFGTVGGLSYALERLDEDLEGQRRNEWSSRQQSLLTLKQRLTPDDEIYFQAGLYEAGGGDLASVYHPAQARRGFRFDERQEPALHAGWHHRWAPGVHTLALLSRIDDHLSFRDPEPNVLFTRRTGGAITAIEVPAFFHERFSSDFTLWSAEAQQIFETADHSLVLGGRYQTADASSRARLTRTATGLVSHDNVDAVMQRANAHGYYSWQILKPLRLTAGVSYDHLKFPENADLAPLSSRTDERDLVAPKAGLIYTPWERGLLRASYTRSMGGLYFDNSVRLEPTQVGGFNQAFRSLVPESVAGLVPGATFDVVAAGFDQTLAGGTWFGLEGECLRSDGERRVGTLTNSTFLPIPDSPSSTRQDLEFRERNVSAYAAQLLGDWFSVSAHYRLSDARLETKFPRIPNGAAGLSRVEQDEDALLHHLSLAGNFHHPSGVFARWESEWYHQRNGGYGGARPGDDFWQHNVFVGYRFPRRHAEVRFGLLNLAGTDYRLNPLNAHSSPVRERTFTTSLRLNF
jgi:tetratricopeptide (TPR) repeat protein